MSDTNGSDQAKPAKVGQTILARNVSYEANLTRAFEPHVFPSGAMIARSAIAVQDRVQNKETKEWSDGPTTYVDLLVFERLVDNVSKSFGKGARVIVTGTLRQRYWAKDDGGQGSALELVVDSIGMSVRFGYIVQFEKAERRLATVGAPLPDDPAGGDYDL